MYWVSFITGMGAGTLIGVMGSALCHIAAKPWHREMGDDPENAGLRQQAVREADPGIDFFS